MHYLVYSRISWVNAIFRSFVHEASHLQHFECANPTLKSNWHFFPLRFLTYMEYFGLVNDSLETQVRDCLNDSAQFSQRLKNSQCRKFEKHFHHRSHFNTEAIVSTYHVLINLINLSFFEANLVDPFYTSGFNLSLIDNLNNIV